MKNSFTAILIAGLFSVSAILSSCAKSDNSANLPKEQQIVGEWYINRIQLNVYSGGTLMIDTILKYTPKPKNIVKFDADGGFEFKFNSPTSNIGTYQFVGSDSIVSVTPAITYRWKMLTLTKVLLTAKSTSTNNPTYPGSTVETYYTFVR